MGLASRVRDNVRGGRLAALSPAERPAVGAPEEVVAAVTAAGFPVTVAGMDKLAADIGEKTMFGRAGGAPTFAVGMAHMFAQVFASPTALALWYHFAIMFEALFILTTLDGNRLTYDTMINTGDVGVIRDGALVRQIQTYYATVDKVLSFEDALEINRVKLVDAQQQAGLSPVDATPADEMATIFGRDPQLLAAAKNYWLYTNRHLKLMKALRSDAERLAETLEHKAAP